MAKTEKGTAKTVRKSNQQAIQGGLTIPEKAIRMIDKSVELKSDSPGVEGVKGEVVAEFTQQLAGFGQFIYNARHSDATLIVENLGFGDIYVSIEPDVHVGDEDKRLLFKDQLAIQGNKLFIVSASEPVVSILEIKQ